MLNANPNHVDRHQIFLITDRQIQKRRAEATVRKPRLYWSCDFKFLFLEKTALEGATDEIDGGRILVSGGWSRSGFRDHEMSHHVWPPFNRVNPSCREFHSKVIINFK